VREYKTYTLTISGLVPETLKGKIEGLLEEMEFKGQKRFEVKDSDGDIALTYNPGDGEDPIFTSYLVPVGHLYWIKDEVNDSDFEKGELVTAFAQNGSQALVDRILDSRYEGLDVDVDDATDLVASLQKSESRVGFVDISQLSPSMKLLSYNGKYFLEDLEGGIKYSFEATGDTEDKEFVADLLRRRLSALFAEPFQIDNVAKVNMTGVTAITRALTTKIDASGNPGYAAERIGDFLKDADLTHVSNEVAFVPGCTPVAGVRFCSKVEHIKNLEDSGVDIVELTGNHDNDYGATYNASSIEMYKDRGWDYFGGGLNAEDASKILYKEVKGSKIAFIGYNYYDTILGTGALAGEDRAGANSYSESKMRDDIQEARENADVVIVDFQFQECYSYPATNVIYPICYKPLASPDQKGIFRKAVDFGADIVIGTQAHQPQTYEIYEGKLIFYGLGNLYFDQIYWIGTMHGLVLSHYMYDGKLIQTQVTTTNYGSDMQTYVSTGEERKLLLELLRDAR
jgi:poly-gamma-glutamate synthesis protein (capsule biosynthesis protein)